MVEEGQGESREAGERERGSHGKLTGRREMVGERRGEKKGKRKCDKRV